MPGADHYICPGSQERFGDPAPDSAYPTRHEDAATCIVNAAGAGHGLVRYQASAWARRAVLPVGIEVNRNGPIAEIVVNYPPVNALPVAGWFELADALISAGRDQSVHVVVLAAEGRGFNAGVDIKEMQRTTGFGSLIGANRGCYAAFAAVYECEVPVVAAVNGFCLGGGIGLVGNADVIVASDDATFGLPEVDRGALGAATHLARLVPSHLMRAMVYTSRTATAQQLFDHGSVLKVVPREELRAAALEVAGEIAAKDPYIIRLAKESLNGIDPIDVKRSYRFEQGFTFEINLSGRADEHRDAFVGKPAEKDTDGSGAK